MKTFIALAALVLSTQTFGGTLCNIYESQKQTLAEFPARTALGKIQDENRLLGLEMNCKRELERERLAKLPPVKFGMSQAEVLETNLGKPNRKMTSIEGDNTIVKFIYDGDRFVVLTNDKVTAIQE